MRIDCIINTENKTGKCKKRYLRGVVRNEIAQELMTKGAELYRTEQAKKKMKIGDCEPGFLPLASTLRVAKVEYKNSTYLDSDPRKAIEIMKFFNWSNSIHSIVSSPFRVHFWTSHQTRSYFRYAEEGIPDISIDATGGMVKPIKFFDGISTSPIFL